MLYIHPLWLYCLFFIYMYFTAFPCPPVIVAFPCCIASCYLGCTWAHCLVCPEPLVHCVAKIFWFSSHTCFRCSSVNLDFHPPSSHVHAHPHSSTFQSRNYLARLHHHYYICSPSVPVLFRPLHLHDTCKCPHPCRVQLLRPRSQFNYYLHSHPRSTSCLSVSPPSNVCK